MTSVFQQNLRANEETMTAEQITRTITAARDSVWVITDTIQKLDSGATLTEDLKNNIQRNVDHLKIIVAKDQIISSGQDISDLNAAIVAGEEKIAAAT
jgi:hypothetical protein